MISEFWPFNVGRKKKCITYYSNIIKSSEIMLQIKAINVLSGLLKHFPIGALRTVVKKERVRVFYCFTDCSKILRVNIFTIR